MSDDVSIEFMQVSAFYPPLVLISVAGARAGPGDTCSAGRALAAVRDEAHQMFANSSPDADIANPASASNINDIQQADCMAQHACRQRWQRLTMATRATILSRSMT